MPGAAPQKVNLDEALASFEELWAPRIVARVNDMGVKVVKVAGEFVAHTHTETDEMFLVLTGALTIEMDDGDVELGAGDLYVVPAGIRHRPVATVPCEILLLEPADTPNQGEHGGTTGVEL